jgi:hypothetical protein
MFRKATLVVLGLGVGLTATLAAFAAGPFFAPDPPTTAGEPFSAVAQTQSTTEFSDGNRIVRSNTVHYYRDGQGRVRVDRNSLTQGTNTSTNGVMAPVDAGRIVIDDPVSGERINLTPALKTAVVFKLPEGMKAPRAIPTPSPEDAPFALMGLGMGVGANGMSTEASAETTSLGQQIVNGVTATGTRVVRVIPVGALGNEKPITSTLEEWKSAELGIPVRITATSSLGGKLTYNLQDLQRAEPAASLFTVPAGYKQMNLGMPGAVQSVAATSTATVTAVKKP